MMSATSNTQSPYYAASSYSALSDHYVDMEYEEEDPNNPGYYYYQDFLGYSFSGGGSHPDFWYWLPAGIYYQRPDQSIRLGDTTGQICSKPTGETTVFSRWADAEGFPTTGMWTQTLLPTTANFTGRTVTEQDPGGGGPDNCWFPGSFYDPLTSITGGYWTVTSSNTWQLDAVGPRAATVTYYRAQHRTPCSVTVPQRMVIDCSSGVLSYKTNWLGYVIGDTTVSSIREGIVVTRTWP